MERPKRLANPIDLSEIEALCEENLDHIEARREDNTDLDHYIYEAVLKALYGPDVFLWMNKTMD